MKKESVLMRTTLDLLIRLAELETAAASKTTSRGPQRRTATVLLLRRLVRDSLPSEVLPYYDSMLDQESELLSCPQVFAMAVLVSAYKGLSSTARKNLVSYFDIPKRRGLIYSTKPRKTRNHRNFGQKPCRALAA